MGLTAKLTTVLQAYVDGTAVLDHVHEWLIDHVQVVADSSDQKLQELDARAWMLISEWDLGHRTEESVRQEIAEALRAAKE